MNGLSAASIKDDEYRLGMNVFGVHRNMARILQHND